MDQWPYFGGQPLHARYASQQSKLSYYGGEDNGNNVVSASSKHTGGLNVVYADGHVEFVNFSVAHEIWWAIGSRNGAETISLELILRH